MIFILIAAILGLGAGYVIYWLRLRRNKGLMNLMDAVKHKGLYVFLETDTSTFGRKIIKTHQNLAITDQKEVIIMPTGTVKSCPTFGIQLGHGDLYKSILVPKDLPGLVEELKTNHKMSNHEIGLFFEETQNINRDTLNQICDGTIDGSQFNQTKLKIFKTLNSNITGFIHTGINRVSIAQNIEHLIKRENIMKLGSKNWVSIAIAVLIILVGIGLLFMLAAPNLTDLFSVASNTVPPIQ